LSDAERIAKLEDLVVKLQAQSSASNTVDNNGSDGASHKAPNAKTIQSKQTTKTSSEKKDKKVAHKAISSVELKKDNQTHSQLTLATHDYLIELSVNYSSNYTTLVQLISY